MGHGAALGRGWQTVGNELSSPVVWQCSPGRQGSSMSEEARLVLAERARDRQERPRRRAAGRAQPHVSHRTGLAAGGDATHHGEHHAVAAIEVERVRLLESRVDFGDERVLQARPGHGGAGS